MYVQVESCVHLDILNIAWFIQLTIFNKWQDRAHAKFLSIEIILIFMMASVSLSYFQNIA